MKEQRTHHLDEFYTLFMKLDFETLHGGYHRSPIERYLLSKDDLNYCHEVERSLAQLFDKWDRILALFPSHSALMKFDKRFDSYSKEGRMFHEKMSVFQAWFNLNADINQLIAVLGRIIGCTPCQMWPSDPSTSGSKTTEEASQPSTPSSASSNETRKATINSSHPTSPNHHQLSSESTKKQQFTLTSTLSVDNVHQPLTFASPLTDYYSR